MRRALGEYVVAGIRTTIPFFIWLLEQPAFVDAQIDTGFLDRELAHRAGRPFLEPDDAGETLAALAAVAASVLQAAPRNGRPTDASGTGSSSTARGSGWQRAARLEGVAR
jgi:acetyl/propionyl-CoA carboxylase alpha subunit